MVHLLLVVEHHGIELLCELTVCLVEGDLDPLLKGGVIDCYLVLKVRERGCESCLDDSQLLSDK